MTLMNKSRSKTNGITTKRSRSVSFPLNSNSHDKLVLGLGRQEGVDVTFVQPCHYQKLVDVAAEELVLFRREHYHFFQVVGGEKISGKDTKLKDKYLKWGTLYEKCYERAVNGTLEDEEPFLAAVAAVISMELASGYITRSCFCKVSNIGFGGSEGK